MSLRFLLLVILVLAAIFYFQGGFKNIALGPESLEIKSGATTTAPTIRNLEPAPSPRQTPQKTETNVSAPPPLRVLKEIPQSLLTEIGTFAWTNTQRIMNNLPVFKENEELKAAAKAKAEDILNKQYFAHVSPEGIGPADLKKNAGGYEYLAVGENLALGNFEDDRALVDAWMESSGHRANILNAKFKELGVATTKGEYEGKTVWVAVQEFGRPASDCPAVDLNLKTEIEAGEADLNQLTVNLDALKAEIDNLHPASRVYAQKVGEYNTLVSQYNALLEKVKSEVTIYNNEVIFFNQCVE